MTLDTLAKSLLALHVPGDPVVLPTVWDPWSAAIAAERGFEGLTVGSHPAAAAMGRGDGEQVSLGEMLAQVRRITSAVELPVSADLESGYGARPTDIVEGLLEAGAVGLNIEDTVHSEDRRLRSDTEHAEYVAAIRQAADSFGVHIIINARTDIILHEHGPADDRLQRTITRLTLAAVAGADVLYPVGLHDSETQRRLCADLPAPVNALARPGKDELAGLAASGVARVSFGPAWQRALADVSAELLRPWAP